MLHHYSFILIGLIGFLIYVVLYTRNYLSNNHIFNLISIGFRYNARICLVSFFYTNFDILKLSF